MKHSFKVFGVFSLIAACSFYISGCSGGGGGGGGGDSSSSVVEGDSGSGGGGGGTSSSFESQLTGTWKSVCIKSGAEVFIIVTVFYDGAGGSNDTVDFYSDSGCASATGLVKTNQTSYSIGESVMASGKSAYEIDITINSWELTQDGAIVQSGSGVPAQFDIVAIEGDTLYTSGLTRGELGPILSPDDRPTTLDLENFFTRQ